MSDEKQINDNEDQSLVEQETYRTGEEHDSVVSADKDRLNDLEKIAALFKTSIPDPAEIPEEVDKFVLSHIKEKSREIRRDRKVVHLFPHYKWAAAAVMGVMVCVVSLHLLNEKDKPGLKTVNTETHVNNFIKANLESIPAQSAKDIDGNGRFDIIDAYLLNRSLKNGSTVSKQLDLNSDGLINNEDIDNIAYTAVSLKRSEV